MKTLQDITGLRWQLASRVSTSDQEQGPSLDSQYTQLEALVERADGEVVGHISTSESATTLDRKTVEHSFGVCEHHQPDEEGVCGACDGQYAVWTTHRCRRCAYTHRLVPWFKLLSEPAVVALVREQAGSGGTVPSDGPTWLDESSVRSIAQSLVSTDPTRIRVEIPVEDAAVSVTMDENLELLEVVRSGPDGR